MLTRSRLALGMLLLGWVAHASAAERLPNIVLIVADDQGYGDVGFHGAQGFKTPNLDRLAEQGVRLDRFYVSQAVCGASRASMLTGCYANRVSIQGAPGPAFKSGLHHDEVTIAELLRPVGYRTAFYGKWHLGHLPPFLPPSQGFDEYFGLPYSNDMWPLHPTARSFPDLPLIEGTTVIDPAVDGSEQSRLTMAYADRAIAFMERHRDQPFFIQVAFAMPHVPLFPGKDFAGSSEQGTYGDVIQEIDHAVGQIVGKIDQLGLGESTLVIYTSDNGPWLSYGNHAGSAGGLREGKGTAWEGGIRVPCVMWMPKTLDAGRIVTEPAGTIDLLPTIAELTKQPLPARKIDGKSLWELLTGDETTQSPQAFYCHYFGNELRAVSNRRWKLVFPHTYQSLENGGGRDGLPASYRQVKCDLELYDLQLDPSESTDVAGQFPEVVAELSATADQIRRELGDTLTGVEGNEIRPLASLPMSSDANR